MQVNAIAPGYISTDNTTALRADLERNTAIIARIPAGRWGEPDDLSGAVGAEALIFDRFFDVCELQVERRDDRGK